MTSDQNKVCLTMMLHASEMTFIFLKSLTVECYCPVICALVRKYPRNNPKNPSHWSAESVSIIVRIPTACRRLEAVTKVRHVWTIFECISTLQTRCDCFDNNIRCVQYVLRAPDCKYHAICDVEKNRFFIFCVFLVVQH